VKVVLRDQKKKVQKLPVLFSKAPEQAEPNLTRAEWESAGKRLLFMAMQ
jgi:hypothetical protein